MAKKKESKSIEELLKEALIPKEEQPYEIPSNWEWVMLGSVSSQPQYGYTTKASEVGNIKYLRTTDITKDNFDWDTVPFCQENPDKIGAYQLFVDDILISRSGSIGENFRIFNLSNNESVFASYMIRIRPKVNAKYLEKYFKGSYYWRQIEELGSGNTLKNISAPKIQSIKVPLPPLSEQKRIVTKLESMLSKIKEAKEKIAEAKESFELRRASILHKAFTGELTRQWREEKAINSEELTINNLLEKINEEKIKAWEKECKKAELEGKKKPSKPKLKTVEEMKISDDEKPYDLPQGWEWVMLGDVGDLARGKSQHRPRNDMRLFGGNYPFIQTGDVARSGRYIVEHNQTLSEFGKEQSRLFPKGTVCITIAANIGDTAILSYDCCFPDSVVGFITSTVVDLSEYVNFYFELIKRDLEHLAPATAQKNINLQILNDVTLPLPPLPEQQEIVARIEALLKAEEDAKDLLNMEEQIDLLEKSILSKAFRGELGTNDLSDEPALELLKRVLGE
ncbi:MAG: restriction endonuclease subunit S [Fusobacteriaceae bacterium]|nr:restriction endonuclease subunit S [Fusobacteriaceae bacterium]MBN2838788.1 restriction endonuclease subunit S [Fusobacteriaceae bacterium]